MVQLLSSLGHVFLGLSLHRDSPIYDQFTSQSVRMSTRSSCALVVLMQAPFVQERSSLLGGMTGSAHNGLKGLTNHMQHTMMTHTLTSSVSSSGGQLYKEHEVNTFGSEQLDSGHNCQKSFQSLAMVLGPKLHYLKVSQLRSFLPSQNPPIRIWWDMSVYSKVSECSKGLIALSHVSSHSGWTLAALLF